MTLRRRTALAVLAACTAFVFMALFSVQSNLAATAADLEEQRASHSLQVASNALYQDVNGLNATVGVWAQRDDSYRFMQDRNAEYIAANLNSAALLNLDVDFVIYVDPDGRMFCSKAVAPPGGEEASLPSGIAQFVTGDGLLARHNSETGSAAGVLFLQDDLVIAASRPIVTSQRQGPMAGALIMGRYLDEPEVRRLSTLSGLPLEIHRVDEAHMPRDFQAARSTLTQADNTVIRAMDGRTMASYILVSEINGSPAFVLRVSEPRDAFITSRAAGQRALALLICLSLAFVLILTLGIDVLVISRVRGFRRTAEALARSQSLLERMAIGGRDEVAAAAEVVNRTLDSLERSNRDLAQSEARNRALVEAIPELLFRIGADGTILETRRPQKVASLRHSQDGVEAQGPKDEILGMIPSQIQHMVMPHMARALDSGQTQIFEFQMTIDGSVSYYEGRVLDNGNGEALVIVRDVTDQRHAEEARQNTVLLREIHDRVKSHLRLMRSYPDPGQHQAFGPAPETEAPAGEPGPQSAAPAESQAPDAAMAGDGRPREAVAADAAPSSKRS